MGGECLHLLCFSLPQFQLSLVKTGYPPNHPQIHLGVLGDLEGEREEVEERGEAAERGEVAERGRLQRGWRLQRGGRLNNFFLHI